MPDVTEVILRRRSVPGYVVVHDVSQHSRDR
jgi:hypothetical protein